MRAGGVLLVALLAVGSAAARGTGEEPSLADWRIERSDRELALDPTAKIVVDNPFGDVRVRTGATDRLSVHAVAQRHADDPRQERLEVGTTAGTSTVAVRYPEDPQKVPESWRRRRVDLAIELPEAAPLEVHTAAGRIEIKGHAGPLSATTSSGEVSLWRRGPADVRSGRGGILAIFLDASNVGPSRFESSTGGIELRFASQTRAEVQVRTQGELSTDFSLTVEPVGPLTKAARALLGGGGPRVEAISGHGKVKLVRLLEGAGLAPDAD